MQQTSLILFHGKMMQEIRDRDCEQAKLVFLLLRSIIHVNTLPSDSTIFLYAYAQEIITWCRIISLAHGVKRDVLNTSYFMFIPLVNMAAEYYIRFPQTVRAVRPHLHVRKLRRIATIMGGKYSYG